MRIDRLDPQSLLASLDDLVALLQATVNGGAAVGFVPPLAGGEATEYWHGVGAALAGQHRVMLVARDDAQVVGTVQLDLARQHNGQHRAEVMKVMVAPSHQRQGIASALMQAIEGEAQVLRRTTLVLDTREGAPSEQFYLHLGYTKVGVIPKYARNADGSFHSTVLFYKLLSDSHS